AAQFRDAIAEWLFEHRHRMTSKAVADVVLELRDAVIERRNRTVNAGTTVLDDLAPAPVPSPVPTPIDAAAPVAGIEGEHSMPVISVSYEGPRSDSGLAGHPIAAGELPARTSSAQIGRAHV